ncbi:MAG: cell division protein FtsZ [Methermicoccaceae archaeon]
MDSLVLDALKYAEKEKELRGSIDVDGAMDELDGCGKAVIKVIGCGGAGNNTLNRLSELGVEGAELIAINTDVQHLHMIRADKKILVGSKLTKGLGAGGDPARGKKAAESSQEKLKEHVADSDLVFITAGMGGGTGTGVAPVVANIARECGAIVVGMVCTPFLVERARLLKAEKGLLELREACDTVIVLDNQKLLSLVPHLPMDQSFSVMDQIISETVKGISETITMPSLINLDFADVKAVMSCGDTSMMLVGEGKGSSKAKDVVKNALSNPLLEVDSQGAKGALIHITGGPDLTLEEANSIAESLTYEIDTEANVIWGARIRDEYEDRVRVLAILTGVRSPQIMGKKGNGYASGTLDVLGEEPTKGATGSTRQASKGRRGRVGAKANVIQTLLDVV